MNIFVLFWFLINTKKNFFFTQKQKILFLIKLWKFDGKLYAFFSSWVVTFDLLTKFSNDCLREKSLSKLFFFFLLKKITGCEIIFSHIIINLRSHALSLSLSLFRSLALFFFSVFIRPTKSFGKIKNFLYFLK